MRAQLTATDATNAGDGETPLFYGRKTASGQGARVPPLRGEAGALSGTGDGGGSGGGARRPVQRPAEGPRPGVLVLGSRAVEPPCVTLQVLLSRGASCTGPDGDEGAGGRAREVGEPPPEERREDAAPSFAAVPRSPHPAACVAPTSAKETRPPAVRERWLLTSSSGGISGLNPKGFKGRVRPSSSSPFHTQGGATPPRRATCHG